MEAIPLPKFRQPPALDDPPLPTIPGDPETTSSEDPASPADSPRPNLPDDDRPAPLPPSPERPAAARTRTSSGGDPKVAAKLVRGLIAIVAGTAAALLARSGRHLRQPTPEQIGDIADPLGAVLARHLPTEILSDDLVDITSAAAGAHAYALDGPLVEGVPSAAVSYPEESP